MMPMIVAEGRASEPIEQRAMELLDRVGLAAVAHHGALNMSGGQQQRVAVARSFAMRPDLILADEPTGNLDSTLAESIFKLMREKNERSGTSFLLVTHNMRLARRCDRIVEVIDGRIAGAGP